MTEHTPPSRTTTPTTPASPALAGLVAALSMIVGRDGDARLAARLTGLGPGDAVVDIGCGPGVAARHAARLGATVTGVDPAPVMLRVGAAAHARARPCATSKAPPRRCRSPTTPRRWCGRSPPCTTGPTSTPASREVRRVLRPGGRFVAIERQTPPGAHGQASHGWTDAQAEGFADLCRAHGFVGVRVEQSASDRRRIVGVIATAP